MKLNREDVKYLVVHCSATQPKPELGAKDIDRWHRQRGFLKIGYHFVITTAGEVQLGRKMDEIGAHVAGHNAESIGICMIGGVDKQGKSTNNFTDEQFITLAGLLTSLREMYPKAVIQGHRDFPGVHKDCPCFDVKSWLKETTNLEN